MRPVPRKLLALSGAVGLAVNTACYTYLPGSLGNAPVMTDVRVTLNPGGTEELARFLGPRVRAADGKIASINADGDMVIGVTSVQLADGRRQPWSGEGLVAFPKAYVASVEVSSLNRRKSYIVAAVVVGAVVALVAVALVVGAGANDSPAGSGSDGPLTSRLPVGARPP